MDHGLFVFSAATLLGMFGIYLGLKTQMPPRNNVVRYYLAIYAKWGGWILGVSCLIGAARVVLIMLGLG